MFFRIGFYRTSYCMRQNYENWNGWQSNLIKSIHIHSNNFMSYNSLSRQQEELGPFIIVHNFRKVPTHDNAGSGHRIARNVPLSNVVTRRMQALDLTQSATGIKSIPNEPAPNSQAVVKVTIDKKEERKEENRLRLIEEEVIESKEDQLNVEALLSNTKVNPEFHFFY